MNTINPYLNFPGTTEEAFNFYRSIFGGEFVIVQRFGANAGGQDVPKEFQNKIMHMSLPIGGNILMATDAIEAMGHKLIEGNNSYICISPESREEADRLFNGLSAGGSITMPMRDMFWGAYYGDFTDKFGTKWMINYMSMDQINHAIEAAK